MNYVETKIRIPVQMLNYLQTGNDEEELQRNAMILYPFIKSGRISHGKAANLLGIDKRVIIELYNNLGFPYLSSISDFEEDLKTIKTLKTLQR